MTGKHCAEYEHPWSKMQSDFAFQAVDWFEVYDCDLNLRFQGRASYLSYVSHAS